MNEISEIMKTYQDINKETIDRWVEEGWEWGKPTSHDEYINAKNGEWRVFLTPTVPVPHEWLEDLKGKKILSRSEEHTSELQSRADLVCRLLLEKKK